MAFPPPARRNATAFLWAKNTVAFLRERTVIKLAAFLSEEKFSFESNVLLLSGCRCFGPPARPPVRRPVRPLRIAIEESGGGGGEQSKMKKKRADVVDAKAWK